MPAWRGGEDPVFALKSLCVMPGNPARGLDSHQGTVTLFDGETGVPTAILDASAVTAVRTAAVSAVATRVLAREDARVLAILGAGVQGRRTCARCCLCASSTTSASTRRPRHTRGRSPPVAMAGLGWCPRRRTPSGAPMS